MHVCVQVHACGDAPVMHTHEAIAALAMAVITGLNTHITNRSCKQIFYPSHSVACKDQRMS